MGSVVVLLLLLCLSLCLSVQSSVLLKAHMKAHMKAHNCDMVVGVRGVKGVKVASILLYNGTRGPYRGPV